MTRELETPHPTMPPILNLSFEFFLSTWKSLYPESNSVIAGFEKSHSPIYILTQLFLVYVVILMQLSKTRIWQNTFLLFLFLFRWCFTQQAPSHNALLGSADHSLAHFSKPMLLPCLHVGFEWERKRRQNFYVLELKSVFSSLGPVLVASVCTLHIRRKKKWVLCCENRMLMTWRRREVPYFTTYFPQKNMICIFWNKA